VRKGLLIAAALICCAKTLSVLAQSQSTQIDTWSAQLTSDDWKTRQKAMENLVGLGEDALPVLQKLQSSSPDHEIRTRASAAIAQILENRLVGPSPITLDLQNTPAEQVFAELGRQAHATLRAPKSLGPLSLKVDHRPFWEVVESLCLHHNLEMNGTELSQNGNDWLQKPTVRAGPLLIRADRLTRTATAHLRPPGEVDEEFNISLTVYAEPKLRVLDFSSSVKLDEVADELGHSLIPEEESNVEAYGNVRNPSTTHWEIGATLHHPKGTGTKIVKFRGQTKLLLQIRAGILETSLAAARNLSKTVEGVRVTVKEADAGHATLLVHRDGRTDAEWYTLRMQLYAGAARLVNESGQAVARHQNAIDAEEAQDGQRMDVHLKFVAEEEFKTRRRPLSEGLKLIWEFPSQVRELSVPFELPELPIP
jgi:hypothetical protein